ncbi:uncharacterized protein LOC141595142 [Silene latifolia]|uniref:uncharacterized protein LOC141595142 n=1 Tax=Silene latifolia TaxID=37657 RepID=UPI003D777991
MEGKNLVLQQGYPMYDNKLIVVKPSTEDASLTKSKVKEVPIWIPLCGLGLKFGGGGGECLVKLAALLGKYVKADTATLDKTRLGYARLMVEVQVGQDFPDKLYFNDEHGHQNCVLVEYEWKPLICTMCKGIGHHQSVCRKPVILSAPKWIDMRQWWGGIRENVSYAVALTSPTKTTMAALSKGKGIPSEEQENGGTVENKIGLYGLVETKIKIANFDSVLNNLGQRCYGINNNVHHPGGRIWIIWLPQFFQVQLLFSSQQQITVSVTEICSRDTFWFTMVYGSNSDTDRIQLWQELKDIKDNCHEAWLRVLFIPGIINRLLILEYFPVFDRFLINHEWLRQYPDGYAFFMNEGLFDHNPCICYRRPNTVVRKSSFRYFNMWGQASEFLNIVQTEWSKDYGGVKMFQVVNKLKNLKKPLRMLNKAKFSNIENAAELARYLLDSIQTQLHLKPNDLTLREAEQKAVANYLTPHKAQLTFLRQKAKVDWLKEGDENTEDLVQIEEAFLEFYTDLLGSSKVTSPVHVPTVRTGNLITEQHASILMKPVTHEEIKQCLFSIPSNKAPGPDGFSSQFFKDSWSVIGTEDIVRQYKRKFASPRCLIKIDLRKAYDTIEWTFLKEMLIALNFPPSFIDKIMTCVTSTAYSLSLNGNSFGFFKGRRGLRQRDHLSPLLFTVCMEYLSRILSVVSNQDDFTFHPLCGPLKLNHLLFYDDLLMFSKGNASSIMWLLKAFSSFSKASGLCLNKEKSDIYFKGVQGSLMNDIMQVSGLRKGDLPFKYLGVPISSKKLSMNEGMQLTDRVEWQRFLYESS